MVALSPRFTFLAMLCTLAALSSAPISDAVVLPLRGSDLASTEMTSNRAHSGAATSFSHRSPHVLDDTSALPLPQGFRGLQKDLANSDDSPSDSPSGGDPHGEKDASDGEDFTDAGSSAVSTNGGKAKAKDRRWNPFHPMKQLSESWFGANRVHYARAPYHDRHRHHHHHHHHHHNRRQRGLRTRHSELGPDRDISSPAITPGYDDHVHIGRSPHHYHHHHHHSGSKKVIVSGDHDHVRVNRSPHSHHHHHDHNGSETVVVSGDHDHVRVGRSPHSHHHHHHHHHQGEHEKVVVSGDHDHVRVDRSLDWQQDGKAMISGGNDHVHRRRSVLIAGEQGQSYVVPRVAKRSSAQELFAVPSLKRRASEMGCAPGYIRIISPSESGGEALASLVLASTNSTSSDNSTTPSPAFVLNASDMDMTPMCLRASPNNTYDSAFNPEEVGVTLLLEMFDAASAGIVPYCATFNPDPPTPVPLTAEKCTDDPVSKDQSQLFAFNRATGVVRPMWYKAQDNGTGSESNGCVGGDEQAAPQSSSPPSAAEGDVDRKASTPGVDQADQALASDFSVLAADTPGTGSSDSSEGSIFGAKNVALVFVAMEPVVTETPGDGASPTPVPVTSTGAETSSNTPTATIPSTSVTATGSPTTQVTVSTSGSVSASAISSAGPNTSVSAAVSSSSPTPTFVPSSTELVSGAHPTPSMMLGVQVVPESASDATSTTSWSASPTVTPVNTQPYEWMFALDP